jgi:hypothetical protein
MDKYKGSGGRLDLLPGITAGLFFIAFFIYFSVFNRYSLAYHEQIQLFRFDWDYFTGFLTNPGGPVKYFSAFLIQFFLYPLAAVFIITLAGIATYILAGYIFRKFNISGVLWSFIPVLWLAAVQSDYTYGFVNTVGLLLALTFTAIYISIRKTNLRYAIMLISWIILYLVIGGFSMLTVVICILHEIFIPENRFRFYLVSGYAFMAAFIPYFLWRFVYFIPVGHMWFSPVLYPLNPSTRLELQLLFAYFPFLLISIKIWMISFKKIHVIPGWNWKTIIIGIAVVLAFAVVIKKYSYDPKNELLFKADNAVQNSEWDNVLKLSNEFSGTNRLMVYFTNLALYKSGKLGDQMFHYIQIDPSYLWLEAPGTQYPYFFGYDIFYHLGFINKAYDWAYDAMVATGYSPRLLKQLVLCSIINGNYLIAEKYLNVLGQSLFYRKWADHYRTLLQHPDQLVQDREIKEKRHMLIQNDFIVDTKNTINSLIQLLENHPDNKMAFEYYMASLLIDKNMTGFIASIQNLKNYGYKELPVHYEEALLEYMFFMEKDFLPEGFRIRESTSNRYNEFMQAYSTYSGDMNLAAQKLYKQYGATYWYYLHFANLQINIR